MVFFLSLELSHHGNKIKILKHGIRVHIAVKGCANKWKRTSEMNNKILIKRTKNGRKIPYPMTSHFYTLYVPTRTEDIFLFSLILHHIHETEKYKKVISKVQWTYHQLIKILTEYFYFQEEQISEPTRYII